MLSEIYCTTRNNSRKKITSNGLSDVPPTPQNTLNILTLWKELDYIHVPWGDICLWLVHCCILVLSTAPFSLRHTIKVWKKK